MPGFQVHRNRAAINVYCFRPESYTVTENLQIRNNRYEKNDLGYGNIKMFKEKSTHTQLINILDTTQLKKELANWRLHIKSLK